MGLTRWIFGNRDEWEYGTACNSRPARRNKKRGNVQFVLWKAGEQGHADDYWHDFDRSWWPTFKAYTTGRNTTERRDGRVDSNVIQPKACPFCGCEMTIRSNQDWHHLDGDHDEACPFDAIA